MATSGTYASFDFVEIIEEAYERLGMDVQALNAGHMRSARRSLNLIFSDWSNRKIKVWATEEFTVTTIQGQSGYMVPARTIDVLDSFYRRDEADTPLQRIAREDYNALPNKGATGRPDRYWCDRSTEPHRITLYPVPDRSGDVVHMWRIRRLEDATGGPVDADIPHRWVEALIAALTLRLYGKSPADKRSPALYQELRIAAEEAYRNAAEEDRDRAPTVIVPATWNF